MGLIYLLYAGGEILHCGVMESLEVQPHHSVYAKGSHLHVYIVPWNNE